MIIGSKITPNVTIQVCLIISIILLITFPVTAGEQTLIKKEAFIKALSPSWESQFEGVKARGIKPSLVDISIRFVSGSTDLADEFSQRQLNELGKALSSSQLFPHQFAIEGHTDNIGSAVYNLKLSQDRATFIFSYLVKNYKIAEQNFQIIGAGEYKPIASNESATGRSINRRVVIKRLSY